MHKLLVVDGDETHCRVLKLAFEKRGYQVKMAISAGEALGLAEDWQPGFASVDLRLPGPSGLALIAQLRSANAGIRVVVLTGYASAATAAEAIHLGAVSCLIKPVDIAVIEVALHGDAADRLALEHIQNVLAEHHGNIAAAARVLSVHRRSLLRKLLEVSRDKPDPARA